MTAQIVDLGVKVIERLLQSSTGLVPTLDFALHLTTRAQRKFERFAPRLDVIPVFAFQTIDSCLRFQTRHIESASGCRTLKVLYPLQRRCTLVRAFAG